MKILKLAILALILWNLPSIGLFFRGAETGSLLSYATIGFLALYYLFETKTAPNWWLITLGFFYFGLSSFQYYGPLDDIIYDTIKYFIVIVAGFTLVKNLNKNELYWFLLIGAISVAFEALYFPSNFGRYSGFYLNPNEAGFICVFGYTLVYGMKNTSLKLLGQFVFTLMGLLTFSRTFIVIWLIVNLISLFISLKNIRILGIGILIFSTLIIIDESVGLNNPRFEQLKKIVQNENVTVNEINDDSRMSTWSKFYDKVIESPFFGSGYGSFSGKLGQVGVHNSYLMIIGEAGLIPFLIFLTYIGYLIFWSFRFFKKSPFILLLTIALALYLLTDHNFFVSYYLLIATMWIQYQIIKEKELLSDLEQHPITNTNET